MSDEDVREWQANRLGAAILMPAPTIKIVLAENLGMAWEDIQSTNIDEDIVTDMADFYQVSREAMQYRFRDLGLTDDIWE